MIVSATSAHQAMTLKLIYCLGFIAVSLMVVNVFMSARVAQDGLAIDELLNHQAGLKTEISLLEQQLLTSTSLQDLSVKAESLGYRPPDSILSLTSAQRIAQF